MVTHKSDSRAAIIASPARGTEVPEMATIIMNRICDMLGCTNPAFRLYALAPATNLWLCKSCAKGEGMDQ